MAPSETNADLRPLPSRPAYGVTTLAHMARYGRMDPIYLLAATRLAPRLAELKSVMTLEQANEGALGLTDLLPVSWIASRLLPIVRGQEPSRKDAIARAIAADPWMALALLSEHLDSAEKLLLEGVAAAQSKRDRFLTLKDSLPPSPRSASRPRP